MIGGFYKARFVQVYSIDEVSRLLEKAAIGSGVAHGLALDLATASINCYQIGIDGAVFALQELQQLPTTTDRFIIVKDGLNIVELLLANPTNNKVKIRVIDNLPLFLGYLFSACKNYHRDIATLTLATPNHPDIIFSTSHKGLLTTPQTSYPMAVQGTQLSLTRPAAHHVAVALPALPHQRLTVDSTTWHQLQKLAANTYVKSSAHSKQFGAGAGSNDND